MTIDTSELFDPRELAARAELAREVTARAAALTWDYFHRGVSVETKADETPVTAADRDAEALLRETLTAAFPTDGFLGEEFGQTTGTSGFRWIIDPIDATKNFVRGIPLFATLVGLEFQGKMQAGFVKVAALDHLYHAVKGSGSFRRHGSEDTPLRVSTVSTLEESLITYSSAQWFDRSGTLPAYLEITRKAGRMRGFGDFYGFLLVAQGSAEAMLEPEISPWDIAPFKTIVEEAGGKMTDWYGADTIYGQGCLIANQPMHALLMELIHNQPLELSDAPPPSIDDLLEKESFGDL